MPLFIAGLKVGGVVGVVTIYLVIAAKEADTRLAEYEYEVMEETAQKAESQRKTPK